uniref:G-protein coupled receptors family 2 profile 1 domain-containing protein n=1 Tax=Oryzias melastigma TaxID=30732 RepID=A0A3B3DN36_ORYME
MLNHLITKLKQSLIIHDCETVFLFQTLLSFPGGLHCNRTFDRYACWPDTPAGYKVNISCPYYLPCSKNIILTQGLR